jgi:hypothetical protein
VFYFKSSNEKWLSRDFSISQRFLTIALRSFIIVIGFPEAYDVARDAIFEDIYLRLETAL